MSDVERALENRAEADAPAERHVAVVEKEHVVTGRDGLSALRRVGDVIAERVFPPNKTAMQPLPAGVRWTTDPEQKLAVVAAKRSKPE